MPEIPYLPLDGKRWRLAMGLRALGDRPWLEVDGDRAAELAEKQRLLAVDHGAVVATVPGSETAARELLALIVVELRQRHPGLVSSDDAGAVAEASTGTVIDTAAALHPVDSAGRLVQEDLCLMDRDEHGRWRLVAASVCFPSRWRLADKIGADLSRIHAPVPGYEDVLGRPTEALFDRITAERPMWRLNWTLIDSPELFQPDESRRRSPRSWTDADPGQTLWFRIERQTVRRLAQTGAVAFTIRTYRRRLAELVAAHPEVAGALRDTLPTVPEASLAYKGWGSLRGPLLDWLTAAAC